MVSAVDSGSSGLGSSPGDPGMDYICIPSRGCNTPRHFLPLKTGISSSHPCHFQYICCCMGIQTINNSSRTEWSPILSVIRKVIDKIR